MALTSEQVTKKVQELLNKESEKESTAASAEAKVETKGEEVKDRPAPTASDPVETKAAEEVKEPEEPSERVKEPKAEPEKKETASPADTDTSSEKKDFNNPAQPSQKEQDEKKHSYTHQEQKEYAFKREVSRRKAAEEKARKLQKELEELRKNKPSDGSDIQTQVNYQVDLKTKESEFDRLNDSIQESQRAEYEEINERRIQNCFAEPEEQKRFKEIIQVEGPKLLKRLDQDDQENAVLSYLDDSDISPILMRVLIAKPNILDQVLSKRSGYGKYQAMAELENNVRLAQKQLNDQKSKEKQPAETQNSSQQPAPAKPLPVVGSVTKSDSTKDSKKAFDPNEYLRKLKAGQRRYTQSY